MFFIFINFDHLVVILSWKLMDDMWVVHFISQYVQIEGFLNTFWRFIQRKFGPINCSRKYFKDNWFIWLKIWGFHSLCLSIAWRQRPRLWYEIARQKMNFQKIIQKLRKEWALPTIVRWWKQQTSCLDKVVAILENNFRFYLDKQHFFCFIWTIIL